MTHHPHVHMIVPGGGLSLDGERWIATKPNFFLPVFVLSKLFRRLMLEKLAVAHASGRLKFFVTHAALVDAKRFAKFLTPLRKKRWFVYAKEPFAGPKQVLAYLSRYTHRVAISNSRLIKADANGVTFKVKNYRVEGTARYTTMTLAPAEFIRRVLIHVLPKGLHRIRHYGLLATGTRVDNIALARKLLGVATPDSPADDPTDDVAPAADETAVSQTAPCPCCSGRMRIIETFLRGETPRHRASPRPLVIRIDTS